MGSSSFTGAVAKRLYREDLAGNVSFGKVNNGSRVRQLSRMSDSYSGWGLELGLIRKY